MGTKSVSITREQNKIVRRLLEGQAFALNNHIALALESDEIAHAKDLVEELRAIQKMYQIFIPDSMWESRS